MYKGQMAKKAKPLRQNTCKYLIDKLYTPQVQKPIIWNLIVLHCSQVLLASRLSPHFKHEERRQGSLLGKCPLRLVPLKYPWRTILGHFIPLHCRKASLEACPSCRSMLETAAAATEHGWGRSKNQGARGSVLLSLCVNTEHVDP